MTLVAGMSGSSFGWIDLAFLEGTAAVFKFLSVFYVRFALTERAVVAGVLPRGDFLSVVGSRGVNGAFLY